MDSTHFTKPTNFYSLTKMTLQSFSYRVAIFVLFDVTCIRICVLNPIYSFFFFYLPILGVVWSVAFACFLLFKLVEGNVLLGNKLLNLSGNGFHKD